MNRLINTILLAWVANAAYAQQYFNVRDPLHSTTSILTGAVEVNSKYYCTGPCIDSINRQPDGSWVMRSGVKFAVYDLNGKKLIDTVYQTPYRNIDPWRNTLFHIGNTEFLLAAECVDTGGANKMILFKFDSVGNVLWQKNFAKPICTDRDFYKLRDLKQDPATHSWLMLSTVSCQTSRVNADFLLTKLDSNFNEIWYKQYGHATLNDIPSKILIEPDGYILAGGRNDANWFTLGFTFRAEIIKTDTAGNVQWTYYSPQVKLTNYVEDIIKTNDGGYVYCGAGDGYEILSANQSSSTPVFKAWVEKINASGNIIWSHSFGGYGYAESNCFTSIFEALDGRLFIFGRKYMPDSIGLLAPDQWELHTRGWLFTLTANGDSLNEKVYYNISTCRDNNAIYDVKKTSDGGYLMAGEARDDCNIFTPPRQQGWLIKVDSNGCMNPQCLFPTNISEEPKEANAITVYPNPANDMLKVKCTQSVKSAMLYLYDVTGRLTLSQSIKQGITQISIQDLPVGIYVYKIQREKELMLQGKVIKQ